MIRFEEVDETTGTYDLRVAEEQKNFVASIPVLLGRAFIFRKFRPKAYNILNGDQPIGMSLYYDDDDKQSYEFAQLFIDERYQNKGFGTEVVKHLLAEMSNDGKYHKVTLSYVNEDEAAARLYTKFGFVKVESTDPEETYMELIF